MSVYFIRAADGNVKIGYSGHVARRVDELIRKHGGELLGCMPGDRSVEAHFHFLFRRQRLVGEWFEPSEGLFSLIGQVANQGVPEDPGKKETPESRLRDTDLKFARECADALSETILQLRDWEPVEVVCSMLAPSLGLSHARLLAIRDGAVDSVTAAEYTKIMSAPDLAKTVRETVAANPEEEGEGWNG